LIVGAPAAAERAPLLAHPAERRTPPRATTFANLLYSSHNEHRGVRCKRPGEFPGAPLHTP